MAIFSGVKAPRFSARLRARQQNLSTPVPPIKVPRAIANYRSFPRVVESCVTVSTKVIRSHIYATIYERMYIVDIFQHIVLITFCV